MAEGLAVSNVVESQFRRYHKFPQWPLVQGHTHTEGQGHNTDYQINLNNSGNMMYITRNTTNNNGQDAKLNEPTHIPLYGQNQNDDELNPSVGRYSPRKWHHGYLRTDLTPAIENKIRHNNQHLTERDHPKLDKNQAILMNPVQNQGQITIHYNHLDVDALSIDADDIKRGKDHKEISQTPSNANEQTQNKSNFLKLKKEYMDRSRAKEWDYRQEVRRDSDGKDLVDTRAMIRYDIEAPTFVDTHDKGTHLHIHKDDERFRIPQEFMHVEKDFEKERNEGSSQFGISTSVTLPKFENRPRNTRFGSHSKVTAYRPSTCLDNHRDKKLENILECPVHNIDTEEGRQIWKEVDSITKESLVPPSSPKKRFTFKSRDTHTSNNSVEFFPSFEKEQTFIGTENKIWNDRIDNNFCSAILANNERRYIPDPSQLVEAAPNKPRGDDDIHIQGKHNGLYTVIGQSNFDPDSSNLRRHTHSLGNHVLSGVNGNNFIKAHDNNGIVQSLNVTVDNGRMEDSRRIGNIQLIYPGQVTNPGLNTQRSQAGACEEPQSRMTTTTLPRITPGNTPLPAGVCQSAPPRAHTSASMYGAYPPKDLSSSVDFLKMPGRINPLAPPPPRKRINWSWETTNQHWENDKRRILMQKREHTRYHSAWSKAFYGAPAEKEAYRRHFRDVLKQQMSDRENSRRDELVNKVKETERAVKYDEKCRSNDAQEYYRKHSYLMLYRDGNKQQMEDKWAENRYNKVSEDRVDRERLRYNPINWSCSLK